MNPAIHALIYGDSGAGKTTGAATFPEPQLVFFFDPFSKDIPYLSKGIVAESKDQDGTIVREVSNRKTGDLRHRLEYFLEATPHTPTAWGRFLARLTRLEQDIEGLGIQTVVLDSVTFMELTARKFSQYKLNPSTKEPRQWYSFGTEALEEILMIRFGTLPVNVVVLAHIDDQKVTSHGSQILSIAAPGRLSRRGPGAFGEVYHAHVVQTADGAEYQWQTRSDSLYIASTQINAPNPSVPDYKMLWTPA